MVSSSAPSGTPSCASSRTRRLFVAVAVPVEADLLRALEELGDLGCRPVRAERLHMTLAFMPAVDARRSVDVERITRAAAAAHRRFPLALTGRIDRFGAKVAWAELAASPALEALATSSRRGLATGGIAMEERAFHPHVTLARAGRRRIDAAMVDRLSAPHTSWWVSSVKLIESQLGGGPARWRTVGDYPLAS